MHFYTPLSNACLRRNMSSKKSQQWKFPSLVSRAEPSVLREGAEKTQMSLALQSFCQFG